MKDRGNVVGHCRFCTPFLGLHLFPSSVVLFNSCFITVSILLLLILGKYLGRLYLAVFEPRTYRTRGGRSTHKVIAGVAQLTTNEIFPSTLRSILFRTNFTAVKMSLIYILQANTLNINTGSVH